GNTWQRSDTKHGLGVGKTSESQIVNLPDGTLRIYARNTGNYVSYSDSKDGGKSWSRFIHDKNLTAFGNCMVSFINYSKKINGKNVIIGSFPSDTKKRASGVVVAGLVGDNNKVEWISKYKVNDSFFAYSCLTELKDSRIGFLYEDEAAHITYKILSISDDGKIS
ncbi:MAG: exo-alpha-sialidase, partial [Clostridia bacterium]|nr:exo-alpha-sialidase [Clostridia bacterium]